MKSAEAKQHNFDQLIGAVHQLASVSVQPNVLDNLKAKVEYDLVRGVIFDLAYDAELGFLSTSELELYELVSSTWAMTHLEMHQPNLGMTNICSDNKLTNEQIAMFQSRMRDKLTQRLSIFSESVEIGQLKSFQMEKLEAIRKLRKVQTEFLETISSIFNVACQLFKEIRHRTQSKVNLHTATVIVEQAESLLAQTINVWYSIRHEARKPSATRDYLCKTKIELDAQLMQLKDDVESLENTISSYRNQDAKYYEIVQRYKECQDQLAVRCDIIDRQSNFSSPNPSIISRNAPRPRRSLSLNFLPTK